MERQVDIPEGTKYACWYGPKQEAWYEVNPGVHLEVDLVLRSAAALREAELDLLSAKFRQNKNISKRRQGYFNDAVKLAKDRVDRIRKLLARTIRLGFRSTTLDQRIRADIDALPKLKQEMLCDVSKYFPEGYVHPEPSEEEKSEAEAEAEAAAETDSGSSRKAVSSTTESLGSFMEDVQAVPTKLRSQQERADAADVHDTDQSEVSV
jgi:hypothetical protein